MLWRFAAPPPPPPHLLLQRRLLLLWSRLLLLLPLLFLCLLAATASRSPAPTAVAGSPTAAATSCCRRDRPPVTDSLLSLSPSLCHSDSQPCNFEDDHVVKNQPPWDTQVLIIFDKASGRHAQFLIKMSTIALLAGSSGSVLLSSRRLLVLACRINKTRRIPTWRTFPMHMSIKCAQRNCHQDLQLNNNFNSEPFWLSFIKDVIWSVRSLAVFLVDQPSQLKYVEWPTFQSTLKTATITLVLVALLIVSLSSVDSAFCYVLALLLRRTA